MEGARLNFRVLLLSIFTLLVAVVYAGQLYSLQVTHGESYKAMSERKIVRSVSVGAARGEVLDRYGRPLITNRVSFSLRFDILRLLYSQQKAESILALIELCEKEEQPYTDTFPVTEPPFRFIEKPTAQQEDRLNRYLAEKNWEDDTAAELMAHMRESYGLPETLSDAEARKVCGILYEVELRNLFYNIPPYVFASDMDIRLVTMVQERQFWGVQVEPVSVREYQTDYAAHILGRVGPIFEDEAEAFKEKGYSMDEIVGKDGVEKSLEAYLRGTPGVRAEETNQAGKVTGVVYTTEPSPGGHVMLTLDIDLQAASEQALERNILRLREEALHDPKLLGGESEGGAVVVMDVNTGEILAAASYPTFSLKNFYRDFDMYNEDPLHPMLFRAIAGAYEPGSTFKMCSAVAALESGVVTTKTYINDLGVYMYYAPSYTPRCYIYGAGRGTHGRVTVSDALKVSCNYYFYEAGRLTGIEALNKTSREFGLGVLTGVDLPGERAGILAGPEYTASRDMKWNAGDTIQAAIGQSFNLFTPLQLAAYVATVANGGTYYTPHFLKTVKSYDYKDTLYDPEPEVRNVVTVSPENLAAVQKGMRMVCQPGGTGYSVFGNYPVEVAAKTGTAQISQTTPNNGVFVAYAPYDKPEIAVAVVVEKGGQGGRVAAIVRDIFDYYFESRDARLSRTPENEMLR